MTGRPAWNEYDSAPETRRVVGHPWTSAIRQQHAHEHRIAPYQELAYPDEGQETRPTGRSGRRSLKANVFELTINRRRRCSIPRRVVTLGLRLASPRRRTILRRVPMSRTVRPGRGPPSPSRNSPMPPTPFYQHQLDRQPAPRTGITPVHRRRVAARPGPARPGVDRSRQGKQRYRSSI